MLIQPNRLRDSGCWPHWLADSGGWHKSKKPLFLFQIINNTSFKNGVILEISGRTDHLPGKKNREKRRIEGEGEKRGKSPEAPTWRHYT